MIFGKKNNSRFPMWENQILVVIFYSKNVQILTWAVFLPNVDHDEDEAGQAEDPRKYFGTKNKPPA